MSVGVGVGVGLGVGVSMSVKIQGRDDDLRQLIRQPLVQPPQHDPHSFLCHLDLSSILSKSINQPGCRNPTRHRTVVSVARVNTPLDLWRVGRHLQKKGFMV